MKEKESISIHTCKRNAFKHFVYMCVYTYYWCHEKYNARISLRCKVQTLSIMHYLSQNCFTKTEFTYDK